MNITKSIQSFYYLMLVGLLSLVPVTSSAESGVISGADIPSGSNQLQNPLSVDSIPELFKAILDIVLIFAIPIVVFFIMYAGFKYVTAQGNPEGIKTATSMLTWSVVGGVLILGAWVLIDVIQGTVDALK